MINQFHIPPTMTIPLTIRDPVVLRWFKVRILFHTIIHTNKVTLDGVTNFWNSLVVNFAPSQGFTKNSASI